MYVCGQKFETFFFLCDVCWFKNNKLYIICFGVRCQGDISLCEYQGWMTTKVALFTFASLLRIVRRTQSFESYGHTQRAVFNRFQLRTYVERTQCSHMGILRTRIWYPRRCMVSYEHAKSRRQRPNGAHLDTCGDQLACRLCYQITPKYRGLYRFEKGHVDDLLCLL